MKTAMRLIVMVSGIGSGLLRLIRACEQKELKAEIVAVGSDRHAPALSHASDYGIPFFVSPFKEYSNRDAWGANLLNTVLAYKPDLVVLSGFMRILPSCVVDALSPNLINTHPSYLPEFPGMNAVEDALRAGVKTTGASVIRVDNGIDTGPVISQMRVKVYSSDTCQTLHSRIKKVEHLLLCRAIKNIYTEQFILKNLLHNSVRRPSGKTGDR
ncbi:MAG: phosphoribosylglycinamide formyltransferase [Tropheryma whipplei]|nr:phosphoribosylglycinamide formyltransferase [Tropheryma whipplei]MCO8182704.1 phosphoribosylglycinamide formyltransferase [Tropheryma whipplei]MCO8190400.1 phosphoribosylglycinamide formyltransferase [Tropheryma whipplei]CAD66777.1 phosphoribosylglycinamide formyltransferase [Tropheryma whipplei TW08/27]